MYKMELETFNMVRTLNASTSQENKEAKREDRTEDAAWFSIISMASSQLNVNRIIVVVVA